MKQADIVLGQTYVVKVSGHLAPVRLESVCTYGKGWMGRNTRTGREIRIKTAAKLRRVVMPNNEPTLDERVDAFRLRNNM